jgi:hypothetical protein
VAFAQLLRTIASGAGPDDERQQDALAEASHRLEAQGEPLAVGFSLLARSHLSCLNGRMDEAQQLARAAHDLSTRIGELYMRMIALTLLARAALGLGDAAAAQRHAVESLLAAQRLGNLNTASYALELWATAELRHGRIEHAGRLLALAERGYQQTSSRPWRTDTGPHRQLHAALHAGLGDRYQQLLAEARDVDLDEAITELARSQASAH